MKFELKKDTGMDSNIPKLTKVVPEFKNPAPVMRTCAKAPSTDVSVDNACMMGVNGGKKEVDNLHFLAKV